MLTLRADDPLAVAVSEAIRTGDLGGLRRLLTENADLATARIISRARCGEQSRSLLHIATDWPGHFPNSTRTVRVLIAAGTDVNAQFAGGHTETPLHWAASCDDVEVLDAMIDAGADIEADGAVIAGGTPLADAVGFGQWNAARRLVERGADLDWIGYDRLTAIDAARRSGAHELVDWLRQRGARSAAELT
jgi:hypothetical protein